MAGEAGSDENIGNPGLDSAEGQIIRYLFNNRSKVEEEIKTLEGMVLDLQSQPREDRVEDEFVSAMHDLTSDISAVKMYFGIQ